MKGSPASATTGGASVGSGRPAGAGRSGPRPGAIDEDGLSAGHRGAGTPSSWLGIRQPTAGLRRCHRRRGRCGTAGAWTARRNPVRTSGRTIPRGRSADGHRRRRTADRARFARLVARPEPEIDLASGCAPDRRPRPAADRRGRRARPPRRDRRAGPDPARRRRSGNVDRRPPPRRPLPRAGFRGPTAAEYGDPPTASSTRCSRAGSGCRSASRSSSSRSPARLGVALVGIGLPGHFIVGGPDGLLVDPADGGRSLTPDDCQALIRRAVGDGVLFHAGMLRPAAAPRDPGPGPAQPPSRPAGPARLAGRGRRDRPAPRPRADRSRSTGRDRGLLLGRMGRFGEAVAALRIYLEERPDAHDVPDVRQVMGIFAGRLN